LYQNQDNYTQNQQTAVWWQARRLISEVKMNFRIGYAMIVVLVILAGVLIAKYDDILIIIKQIKLFYC